MPRTPRQWRRSKKLCRQPRRDRRSRRGGQADRDLVPGRGPDRSEEQDHPALGTARDAALGTARSADPLDLHFWRHLPGPRNWGRSSPAALQHAMMALHLAEISQMVTPGAHAVLLLDQAGWHLSDKLDIPDNITLMPLPPKSPELNPVENVWQFMRDNWLSNRVFRSYDDILEHCCYAWNALADQPWTIMSIVLRNWAHGS